MNEKDTDKGGMAMGAMFIVIAFFFVAVMGAVGKLSVESSPALLVFFQSSVALLLFMPWFLSAGTAPLKTKRPGLHAARAATGLASQALMFLAVRKMPLVDAVLLSNSAPLFIPLVGRIWLKQRAKGVVWASVGLGLVGVCLILKPSAQLLANPAGLLALGSAVCSALTLVCVGQLSETESNRRILFYYFAISSALTGALVVTRWQTPSASGWAALLGLGVAMAAAQLFIVLAYRRASAGRIAPFNYSVVVFSGLMGWVFWGHVPDMFSLLGFGFVILGGVLSLRWGGDPPGPRQREPTTGTTATMATKKGKMAGEGKWLHG